MKEEVVQATSLFDKTHYLTTQDVATILSRSYQVDEFSWTTGQTPATPLGTYRFPKLLFDQPWVKNILQAYKYFRFKEVLVTFRIQSTNMHQGALNISHVFNEPLGTTESFRNNVYRRRNNRPLLFSAMPGNSQVLHLPWNNPRQWARVYDVDSDSFNVGVVDVDVLAQLRTVASTVVDCKVTVFASFVGAEVAGASYFTAQGKSETPISESLSKAVKGVVDTAVTVIEPIERVVDLASNLAPMAALVLDKPIDGQAPTRSRFAFGEGQLSTEGTSLETVIGASQQDTLSQQTEVMGPGAPNPKLLSCLQTPAYLEQHTFKAGDTEWDDRVNPITFAEGASSGTAKRIPTFLNYFTCPFRYWRGSITYNLFFFCSSFTSARVRVTWTPVDLSSVTLTGEEGNLMSRVVEIRGDTHTSVTIPYAKPELWSRVAIEGGGVTAQDGGNGVIQVDLIDITGISADPAITMLVYQGAGPDYQVGCYDDQMFITSEAQGSISRWFTSEGQDDRDTDMTAAVWEYSSCHDPIAEGSGAIFSGYAQTESYDDVCSLMKRFHNVAHTNGAGTGTRLPPVMKGLDNGSRDSTNYLLNCFRYYRGSIRVQVVRDADNANHFMYAVSGEGMRLWDNQGSYGLSNRFTLPWYSALPFEKTTIDSVGRFGFSTIHETGSSSPDEILWAFGDDLGVSALFSPPVFNVLINP